MADYQSAYSGEEVDNAVKRIREWINCDTATKPTDGSNTNISTVTISGSTYHVLWQTAPTSSNQVYGIGLLDNSGRIYRIYNNKGSYSALELGIDTKNTAGSTNSNSKLFLIGATEQNANPQTYSNIDVYTQSGVLYAQGLTGKASTDLSIQPNGNSNIQLFPSNYSGTGKAYYKGKEISQKIEIIDLTQV